MKNIYNEKFIKELQEIKERLPKRYFSLIDFFYPGKFTKNQVYNVLNNGTQNPEVLKALKRICKKKEGTI